MVTIDKVKIIVVGDSGVGKTSLTHLITKKEPITRPLWTVGCTIDIKLHEYREGTPDQKSYFVELWDIGGSASHRNARNVFYAGVNGIILVHDLTNKKSYDNLQKWLSEVLNSDNHLKTLKSNDYDPEQYIGRTIKRAEKEMIFFKYRPVESNFQIPVLIIGTKSDVIDEKLRNTSFRSNKFSEECGADEIFLDCLNTRSLAPGTGSAVKITKFFDKIISSRYQSNLKEKDKRKGFPPTSTKYYFHRD